MTKENKIAESEFNMDNGKIKIKKARSVEDAKFIGEFLDQIWKNYQRPHQPDDILKDIENGKVYLILEYDGQKIGTAFFNKKTGEIGGLSIKKEYRGRGLGKILSRERVKMAQQEGLKVLFSEAVTSTNASQKILEDLGFKITGFMPLAVEDAPRESNLERTSFVIYCLNGKFPERGLGTVKKLADIIGLQLTEVSPVGIAEKLPQEFELFGVRYLKVKEIEEMLWAEKNNYVPIAFYPDESVLYVKKEEMLRNLSKYGKDVENSKFTPKSKIVAERILEEILGYKIKLKTS